MTRRASRIVRRGLRGYTVATTLLAAWMFCSLAWWPEHATGGPGVALALAMVTRWALVAVYGSMLTLGIVCLAAYRRRFLGYWVRRIMATLGFAAAGVWLVGLGMAVAAGYAVNAGTFGAWAFVAAIHLTAASLEHDVDEGGGYSHAGHDQ